MSVLAEAPRRDPAVIRFARFRVGEHMLIEIDCGQEAFELFQLGFEIRLDDFQLCVHLSALPLSREG